MGLIEMIELMTKIHKAKDVDYVEVVLNDRTRITVGEKSVAIIGNQPKGWTDYPKGESYKIDVDHVTTKGLKHLDVDGNEVVEESF